jgi:hypothetical protein
MLGTFIQEMKCKPEVYGKNDAGNIEVVDCSSKNEVLTPLASEKVQTPLASEILLTPLNSQKALTAWLLQASPGSTSFENFSTSFP